MGKALLLTGVPGCGKTTVVRRVLADLGIPAGGFYTQEIREAGVRRGFEILTLDGRRGVLAHTDMRSGPRVGKYGVDLSALEEIGAQAIVQAAHAAWLVVIDEIGPMEVLSGPFRQAVLQALESRSPVFGTITARSIPFADQVKARRNVRLIEVHPQNRDRLPEQVTATLREWWAEVHGPENVTERSP